MERRPVILRCYPKDDELFEATARRALVEALGQNGRIDDVIRRVEGQLRRGYPYTIVHRREPLADPVDAQNEVWYVYRDGSPLHSR